MFTIIGIIAVFGAIVAGYLLEGGNLVVLVQPAELVIIGGAAAGTLFVANPLYVNRDIVRGLLDVFKGSRYSTTFYLETLRLLNDLFLYARKSGLVKLEQDVEEPEKSQVFKKYPNFLKDHHALYFVCDTLRMSITGGVNTHELDQMMELDIEVHHQESSIPVTALTTVADSLPGLGIVAAVLGVVITMGALGGPPEEIGHKVAAALVGTFLGVLLCYGLVGPLAAHLAKLREGDSHYYSVLRNGIIAFTRGSPPMLALEFARRTIPNRIRPSFKETEAALKGAKNEKKAGPGDQKADTGTKPVADAQPAGGKK